MKAGGGKAKGASFEREICKRLSLWVSAGKREDLYWRTAMSGGRATVAKRRGIDLAAQAGDISAVHPNGHVLTKELYFELKHVRDLGIDRLIIRNTGPLANFWHKAMWEADAYGKSPVIIARQNGLPILLLAHRGTVGALHGDSINKSGGRLALFKFEDQSCELWLLDAVLGRRFNLK